MSVAAVFIDHLKLMQLRIYQQLLFNCMRIYCMRKNTSLISNLVQKISPLSIQSLFSSSNSSRSCWTACGASITSELGHSLRLHLLNLLDSLSKNRSLAETKCFHAVSVTIGDVADQPTFINNNILSFYVTADEVFDALKVFDKMPERNVVSYNTMIGGLSKSECVEMALELFCEMRRCGYKPTQFTFCGLLCCIALDVDMAWQLYALVMKNGFFYADAFTGTALLGFMGRNGCLDDAVDLFDDMPWKNLVTWNSMVALLGNYQFVRESLLHFRHILRLGIGLSESSFVGVLSGIRNDHQLAAGRQLQGLAIKHGYDRAVSVSNSFLSMFPKCMDFTSAQRLFHGKEPVKDVVSWNTVITSFAKSDTPLKAIKLFAEMCAGKIIPNHTTFTGAINACASLRNQSYGGWVHAKAVRIGLYTEACVGSALVDFYAKVDSAKEALQSFDDIFEKNVVSWSSLIPVYSATRCSALLLVKEMLRRGFSPNEFTLSAVLKSSSALELQQLHCYVLRTGYEYNEYVQSSLITSYAKNGHLTEALYLLPVSSVPNSTISANVAAAVYNKTGEYRKTQELICSIEEPDDISWNILIAACLRNENYQQGIDLFKHMLADEILYDSYTIVSLLSACCNLCSLALGSSIHGLLTKTCYESCDTFVFNVLIDMYGKCGSIQSSVNVFNQMTDRNRNLISWTVIISTLGLHGYAHESLQMLERMKSSGFEPNAVTFFVIMTACKHGGLVKEGMEVFKEMRVYGVQPDMGHYQCFVELLARHGFVKEAEDVICNMPFPPDALVWRGFLNGSRIASSVDYHANGC